MPYVTNHGQYRREYEENIKYKLKCHQIKKDIKELVYENAALCDLATDIQDKVNVVKEERKFLLLKLYQFDPSLTKFSNVLANSPSGESTRKIKKQHRRPNNKSGVLKPRKKLVEAIPLDPINGRPLFPINLKGGLTIHVIGEVTDRPEYHTEDVIYPIGFISTRIYGSTKDPEQKCVYTCRIYDDGSSLTPTFEIAADNGVPPIIGRTPDYCHTQLLLLINGTVQEQVVNTRPKGNAFFGISHPTVLNLIQQNSIAKKCSQYKWNKFEIVSKNTVVLPEENDASISFDSLQRSITFSKYHMVPEEIKEEPPDEIMDTTNNTTSNTLRELLTMS